MIFFCYFDPFCTSFSTIGCKTFYLPGFYPQLLLIPTYINGVLPYHHVCHKFMQNVLKLRVIWSFLSIGHVKLVLIYPQNEHKFICLL